MVTKRKRTWRIGTVSMGLSLIFLGVLLFMKQALGMDVIEPILVWWPLILIVLGLEIVAYLFVFKQDSQTLRYDFISIVFIAILGSAAVLFTLLNSFGIAEEIETARHLETKTYALPEWGQNVSSDIEKVVVVEGNYRTEVDVTTSDELHVLGTYRITSDDADAHSLITSKDDVGYTKVVGQTLYVYLKDLPRETGMFAQRSATGFATIVVPERLEVEVRRY